MKPLHKIPKEKIVPLFSNREKRGMVYLHALGYTGFRRDRGDLWTIYPHNTNNTPLDDIRVIDYDYPDQRNIYTVDMWNPEWIRE